MKVSEVMSSQPEYINASASIREAAQRMDELQSGFIPIVENEKIVGIVTDRDIVKRAVVDGQSLDDPIAQIKSPEVLYCAEDDDVKEVLRNMDENHVQRLIVLNNLEDKNFVGVVSLSDIADYCDDEDVYKQIVACCRHYH